MCKLLTQFRMTRFAALTALQSHVIYIYRTDGSRILVELCKKFRSISIGITVGKPVGITYLVTRKAFIFAQLKKSHLALCHTSSSARILEVFRSELRLDMQMASPVWWQEMCFFLLSDEDVFDHEVAPRAIHLHRQKSAQAGFLLSDHWLLCGDE
jgi:hypothetical protein